MNDTVRARAFVDLVGSAPIASFIGNLDTAVTLVTAGPYAVPATVTTVTPTCYLCCPSQAYIAYAREELRLMRSSAAVVRLLSPLFRLGRLLIQGGGLDRQVQPNNWLVATNPVPRLAASDLADLVRDCIARWPDHAIVWRSLDAVSGGDLMTRMRAASWRLLPARMIYLFDCRDTAPKIGRDERRDRAALAASPYDIVDGATLSPGDFARAAALYRYLYVDKYTPLNPHYTPRFLSGMVDAGLLEITALRGRDGRIDGVVGFLDGGAVMTAPIVGYDTALPLETGLYRMLMALAFQRARARRMLFNASAGADGFKRNRGAAPVLEYTAVYDRHLAPTARLATATLGWLLSRVGVPLLESHVA